jgi:hypothetical protein
MSVFKVSKLQEMKRWEGSKNYDDVDDISKIVSHNLRQLDKAFAQSLAESIKSEGQLAAAELEIVEENGVFILRCIDGHHRLEAQKILRAGHPWNRRPMPVSISWAKAAGGKNAVERSASVIRKEETIFDRADIYAAVVAEGRQIKDVAVTYGVDRKTIERTLIVLKLPDAALQYSRENIANLRDTTIQKAARLFVKTKDEAAALGFIRAEVAKRTEPNTPRQEKPVAKAVTAIKSGKGDDQTSPNSCIRIDLKTLPERLKNAGLTEDVVQVVLKAITPSRAKKSA